MARPERNTIDYFPFICEDGKKMFYIEETYGNDGFATVVKILRALAKTEYHYLDLSKNTTLMFMSAICKVSKETLTSIIKDLVDLDKFNRVLWEENQIIWCQDFVDSIQDAYKKRNNKCINLGSLLELLDSLGIRKLGKSEFIVPVKPQRKEKDIKEDKSKLIPDVAGECLEMEEILNPTSFPTWREECRNFMNDDYFKKAFCKDKKLPMGNAEDLMRNFIKKLNVDGDFKNAAALRKHFNHHYEKHLSIKNNTNSHSKGFVEVPEDADYDNMETW